MKFSDLNLKNSVNSDFLYYSWINLKNKRDFIIDSTRLKWTEPLSKSWFNKASILLRKGSYVYSTKNTSSFRNSSFSYRKAFLQRLKNKIVENAFLLILESHLSGVVYSKSINLTECLRL